MTIKVRRAALYGVVGLLGGFVAGLLVGKELLAPEQSQPIVATAGEGETSPSRPVRVAVDGRPFRGPKDARVTVVEFLDYECPFCKRHFRETLPEVLKNYEGRIRYVVRNFPLPAIHPTAQKAAEGAECAFEQGKFWEYHDKLLAQESIDADRLKPLARELGMNSGKFDSCLDSGAKADQVQRDLRDGQSYGVTGTPTFFFNGEILKGVVPYTSFKPYIERHLTIDD